MLQLNHRLVISFKSKHFGKGDCNRMLRENADRVMLRLKCLKFSLHVVLLLFLLR